MYQQPQPQALPYLLAAAELFNNAAERDSLAGWMLDYLRRPCDDDDGLSCC